MPSRKSLAALVVVLLATSLGAADTKVVKMTHVDGFSIMGQTQPAEDREQVTWIGDNKMHMNQGDTSTIVRMDLGKLYVVNHSSQTYHVLDLPIDLNSLVPPEMQQMLTMMQFDVTVTPIDEHKKVEDWDTRRYDMTMSSQMFTMKTTMWATKVAGFDPAAFQAMYVHLNSLQPGMAKAAQELGKVDGIVVEQKGVMTMMGNEVNTSEKAVSIEDLEAPAGTYDPPDGYTEKPFDFMAQMQR